MMCTEAVYWKSNIMDIIMIYTIYYYLSNKPDILYNWLWILLVTYCALTLGNANKPISPNVELFL